MITLDKVLLKRIQNGENTSKEVLGIDTDNYCSIIYKLYYDGYITEPVRASDDYISLAGCALTEKGLEYINKS
ncbi:hypothetical protein HMPREF9505_01807 [Enterococcus faecalis TX0109]|nr:hypothetical protein HMPREF9505_01807 [Enterococcus faecalis TX0109]